MTPTIIITIISITTLIALALLLKGLIGYQSSNHTHCKKCKYNLNNLNTQINNTTNCPECGVNITLKKSTQQGLRKKQAKFITSAIIILITTLTPTIYIITTNTDLNPYKPLWLLNSELNASDTQTADNAFQEIITRIQSKKLTTHDALTYANQIKNYNDTPKSILPEKQIKLLYVAIDSNIIPPNNLTSKVVPIILNLQNNHSKPWHNFLGDTILLIQNQKTLPPKQWQQFYQNLCTHNLLINNTLPLNAKSITYKMPRTNIRAFTDGLHWKNATSFFTPTQKNPRIYYGIEIKPQKWTINNQTIHTPDPKGVFSFGGLGFTSKGESRDTFDLKKHFPISPLKIGKNKITTKIKYRISKIGPNENLVIFNKSYTFTPTVIPAPQIKINQITDIETQNALFKSLQNIYVSLTPKEYTQINNKHDLIFSLDLKNMPITFSFDLYIKYNKEKPLFITKLYVNKNKKLNSAHFSKLFTNLPFKPNQNVHIILIPNKKHAINSADNVTEIFGSPIIFKNIPVRFIKNRNSISYDDKKPNYTYKPQIYNPKDTVNNNTFKIPPKKQKPFNPHLFFRNLMLETHNYKNEKLDSPRYQFALNINRKDVPLDISYRITIKPKNKPEIYLATISIKQSANIVSSGSSRSIPQLKNLTHTDIILTPLHPKQTKRNIKSPHIWHTPLILKNVKIQHRDKYDPSDRYYPQQANPTQK